MRAYYKQHRAINIDTFANIGIVEKTDFLCFCTKDSLNSDKLLISLLCSHYVLISIITALKAQIESFRIIEEKYVKGLAIIISF